MAKRPTKKDPRVAAATEAVLQLAAAVDAAAGANIAHGSPVAVDVAKAKRTLSMMRISLEDIKDGNRHVAQGVEGLRQEVAAVGRALGTFGPDGAVASSLERSATAQAAAAAAIPHLLNEAIKQLTALNEGGRTGAGIVGSLETIDEHQRASSGEDDRFRKVSLGVTVVVALLCCAGGSVGVELIKHWWKAHEQFLETDAASLGEGATHGSDAGPSGATIVRDTTPAVDAGAFARIATAPYVIPTPRVAPVARPAPTPYRRPRVRTVREGACPQEHWDDPDCCSQDLDCLYSMDRSGFCYDRPDDARCYDEASAGE